jgi:sirohydrochlorin cobaltochelatase
MRAIILFAHGARDPQWVQPFKTIQALARARLVDTPVELAFLEMMRPDLATAATALIEHGAKQITIVPLFMAQGGHLKHDVPQLVDAIRRDHPHVQLHLTPPIGEVDAILHAIADWIVDAR